MEELADRIKARKPIDWNPRERSTASRTDVEQMMCLAYTMAKRDEQQQFVCKNKYAKRLTIETSKTLDRFADRRYPIIEVNPDGTAYLFR